MLAELAIANAAFKVIKTTLINGKQLLDAGDAVGKYFKAEKAIAVKAASNKGNVLEAFQAREQLAKQESELKFLLNKQRINGYSDFIKFKAEYTRNLREAEKVKVRRRIASDKAFYDNLEIASKVGATLIIIIAAAFGVAWYLR